MYFSERRKQGLGSLRPGYFLGGNIGSMLMGNAVNWGLGKGMDYLTKSPEQREKEAWEKTKNKFGIIDYVDQSTQEEDDDTNKTSGFKGALGGGLMNLLATAILGPLMGPIALTIGKGLMNKNKGLGFLGGDGSGSGIGPGPKGPGPQIDWYTGSDEKDKDNEWDPSAPTGVDAGTADIQDFADIMPDNGDGDSSTTTTTTSAPSHIGPTGHDIHGNGDSGGSGGSSSSDQGETSSDSGFSGGRDPSDRMATGGRVSYSKGGIASLWQR
jgi:hypothetical protein